MPVVLISFLFLLVIAFFVFTQKADGRRKLHSRRLIIFGCIIAGIVAVNFADYAVKVLLPGENSRIVYVQEYLNNRYDHNFVYAESLGKNEKGQYIYVFTTNDEREINFEARYWIGPVYLPWGNVPFTRTKHVGDNLGDAVVDYVVTNSPYARYEISDVSFGTLEEYANNLTLLRGYTKEALDEFSIALGGDTTITVVFGDKECEIQFDPRTGRYTWESIRRDMDEAGWFDSD